MKVASSRKVVVQSEAAELNTDGREMANVRRHQAMAERQPDTGALGLAVRSLDALSSDGNASSEGVGEDGDDLGDAEFERAAAAGAPLEGKQGTEEEVEIESEEDGEDEEEVHSGDDGPAASDSGSDRLGQDPSEEELGVSGRDGGGNKAASFARAFAKVMGGAAAASASGAGAPVATPILAGSKSLGKRKREEAEEERTNRVARQLRAEMRRRGHVVAKKKGDDPESDAVEKALMKTATRGVVRLFNAVAKAQHAQREAAGGGARGRAARLSKAGFLAELRGAAPGAAVSVPAAAASAAPTPGAAPPAAEGAAGGKGWAVLREGGAGSGLGLVGVPGSGVRMRDWDTRAGSSDEETAPDELGLGAGVGSAGAEDSGGDSGDDSGDGGW